MVTASQVRTLPLVEVIGKGFVARGRLLDAHVRVSDHFNEQRSMVFLGEAEITGVSDYSGGSRQLGINRDDIVIVVPVEEVIGPDALRIEKLRIGVRMLADGWTVTGQISLVPGVSLERFVNIGQESFIPLTGVHLIGPDGGRDEDVALVQRHAIRMLIPVDAGYDALEAPA